MSLQIVAQNRGAPEEPTLTRPNIVGGNDEEARLIGMTTRAQNPTQIFHASSEKQQPEPPFAEEIHNNVSGGLGAKSNSRETACPFHKIPYANTECQNSLDKSLGVLIRNVTHRVGVIICNGSSEKLKQRGGAGQGCSAALRRHAINSFDF